MAASTIDLTTVAAPQAGDSKRDYAARLGLAKAGTRGRFSADATAVITHAESNGFVFSDPVKAAPKPRAAAPAASATPRVTPATVQAALSAPRPTVASVERAKPVAPALPQVRPETVAYAVEPSKFGADRIIARKTCGSVGAQVRIGCQKPVESCACVDGPLAPHFLDTAGSTMLLRKPVA